MPVLSGEWDAEDDARPYNLYVLAQDADGAQDWAADHLWVLRAEDAGNGAEGPVCSDGCGCGEVPVKPVHLGCAAGLAALARRRRRQVSAT